MSRRWLVILSLVAHAAAAIILFVTGVWKLERLDPGRANAALGLMQPMGDRGGGGEESKQAPPVAKKQQPVAKKPPKSLVQPTPKTEETAAAASDATGTGDGEGDGKGEGPPGTSDGDGTAGEPCLAPPCGGAPTPPPVPPAVAVVAPTIVPPTMFSALRTSGETQIVPSDPDKTAMLRDGTARTAGSLKVCLDATGRISSVAVVGTTKYPSYDAKLVAAVRAWRYQPYRINGTPAPACSMVTFVYTIR